MLEDITEHEWQPNDTFIAPTSSCHVIGGANATGKTSYLQQVDWHDHCNRCHASCAPTWGIMYCLKHA